MRFSPSHASTIFSRSSSAVIHYLESLKLKADSHALLYALSSNAPRLGELVDTLNGLCSQSVGCLSSPIPLARGRQLPSMPFPTFTCSVALFPLSNFVTFRSTIAGARKANVGRYRTASKKSSYFGEEEFGSENEYSGSLPVPDGLDTLPHGLNGIRSVLNFSDDAYQGIAQYLSQDCSDASKLGLIGSSTVFVTGRPFTLMRNGEIFSSGSVGVAGLDAPVDNQIVFHGLTCLEDRTMRISTFSGNLIETIDGGNPAQQLLDAMRKCGVTNAMMKEDEMYVGVGTESSGDFVMERAYRVLSGDPTRGMIALQDDAYLHNDMQIRFYQFMSDVHQNPQDVFDAPETGAKRISFIVGSQGWNEEVLEDMVAGVECDNDMQIFHDVFLASSEHGCLHGPPRSAGRMKSAYGIGNLAPNIYRCSAPGAVASWVW